MANPSFSQYKHNAIIEGAEIREIELIDGDHDLDSMLVRLMIRQLLFGYVVPIIQQAYILQKTN